MKTELKSTDTRTGKKPGPVPKPKGIVQANVWVYVNKTTFTKEVRKHMEINFAANQYATPDQFRKAAKKAIDTYFKSL